MNNNKQYLARAPAEHLDLYEVPGLYPVHVDDCFKDGRYEIWNKLGWGGFSTVWLAHDKEYELLVILVIYIANMMI